jgi:hypothetical protein
VSLARWPDGRGEGEADGDAAGAGAARRSQSGKFPVAALEVSAITRATTRIAPAILNREGEMRNGLPLRNPPPRPGLVVGR